MNFNIQIPIYKTNITFIIGKKKFNKYINKLVEGIRMEGDGIYVSSPDNEYFIGLVKAGTNKTISIASHEILHAAKDILRFRGIDDEEAECYLVELIMIEFLNKYKKRGKYK